MHGGPGPAPGPGPSIPAGMMPFNAQAMVAQQNANMEVLERRRERERAREAVANVSAYPLKEDNAIFFFLAAPKDRGGRVSG